MVEVDNDQDRDTFVMLDGAQTDADFITLADDTIMLSDLDVMDSFSVDMDDTDISFIL